MRTNTILNERERKKIVKFSDLVMVLGSVRLRVRLALPSIGTTRLSVLRMYCGVVCVGDVKLWNADCLQAMQFIPDGSVDMVLCDPPYGTTACKWDTVIPFEPMWGQLKRIIKPNGAICLFGT